MIYKYTNPEWIYLQKYSIVYQWKHTQFSHMIEIFMCVLDEYNTMQITR